MDNSFSLADIMLLILFVPAIIGGIRKGFIRQIISLLALILGIWAGYHFSYYLSGKLNIWLDTISSFANILSFVLIFGAILLIGSLIGQFVAGIFKVVLLGWLDKLLGIIFSIIKVAFILSIVIYILNSLDSLWSFLPKEYLAKSFIYPVIEKIAPIVFPYLKDLQHVMLSI
jgi:membrane protein required for colicin V production